MTNYRREGQRDLQNYKTTLILRVKDEVQVMLSKGCVNAINVLPRSWRLRYILWEIGLLLQFCNLIHVLYEFYHKRPRMLTVSTLSKPNHIKETEIFKESIFLISLVFPTSNYFKESEQEAWNLHLDMISDFKVDIHFFRSE